MRFHPYRRSPYKPKPQYTLFHHQHSAVEFLKHNYKLGKPGTIMAISMGLGKTLIALHFFVQTVLKKNKKSKLLFITKRDIQSHIHSEIDRFVPKSKRDKITVSSYQEAWSNFTLFMGMGLIVVMDESHEVYQQKNIEKKCSCLHRTFTILLTGTAGSKREQQAQWRVLLARPYFEPPIVFEPPESAQSIITKPENITLQMDLNQEQLKSYQSEVQKALELKGIQLHHKLTQIRKALSATKIPLALQIIHNSLQNRAKIAVVSAFNSTLTELQLHLPRQVVSVCFRNKPSNRAYNLQGFLKSPDKKVLLVSTNFGSMGIDLGCCQGMLLMEPCWKHYVFRQTNARLSRIGQVQNQQIVTLLTEAGLEKKLYAVNSTNPIVMD